MGPPPSHMSPFCVPCLHCDRFLDQCRSFLSGTQASRLHNLTTRIFTRVASLSQVHCFKCPFMPHCRICSVLHRLDAAMGLLGMYGGSRPVRMRDGELDCLFECCVCFDSLTHRLCLLSSSSLPPLGALSI